MNTISRFRIAVASICIISIFSLTIFFSLNAYAIDGAIDQTFNSNGSGGQGVGFNNVIQVLEVQDDGKIILGGNFTTYNGTSVGDVIRLNDDGTIDQTFNSNGSGGQATGFNNAVTNSDIQADGKILFTGNFTQFRGATANRIIRLNADGTPDTVFNTNIGTGFNANSRGVMELANGQIIVGGNATNINGTAIKFMARLNADGTKDTAFITALGTGFNTTVQRFAQQSDGKIIAIGAFTSFNGRSVGRIVRLNLDGTFDSTFNVGGSGFNWDMYSIRVTTGDKLLVGGDFSHYNGVATGSFIRLNSDGSRDTTFNVGGTGAHTEVDAIFEQPNGKIIIEGTGLVTYNGVTRNYLARLNADGTLDTTFDPGVGFNVGILNGVHGSNNIFRANGNMVVGGNFTSYNGTAGLGYILSLQTDITNPIFSSIHIASNNSNPQQATIGDVVTLSFNSNHPLVSSTITVGGQTVTPVCVASTGVTVGCTAPITVTSILPISDGVVTFSITGTTVGGTTGPETAVGDSSLVTVSRAAPDAPTVTVSTPTNNVTPIISGTCSTGNTVVVSISTQILSVLCLGNIYAVAPSALASGSYSISVVQDQSGNTSLPATTSLIIDTTLPTVRILLPTGNVIYGDNTVSGECESGIIVVVSGTGFTSRGGAVECVDGLFSVVITITDNVSITATQTDDAGNIQTAVSSNIAHRLLTESTNNQVTTTTVLVPIVPITSQLPSTNQSAGNITSCVGGNQYDPVTGQKCPPASNVKTPFQFFRNLGFGSYGFDVKYLQQFLNSHGSLLATTSYGSPNNETNFFGKLTKKALENYQKVYGIYPTNGFFGPITMKAVNAILQIGM